MSVDVALGLQWGDEGKGKVVDRLAQDYDLVARFQGGPNAGHTLHIGKQTHVLHQIPSGVLHERVQNFVGHGAVLDPVVFRREVDLLQDLGISVAERLLLSRGTFLILPTHRAWDAQEEQQRQAGTKIESTLRGIGPCYQDKIGRRGLRLGDIHKPRFETAYRELTSQHRKFLSKSFLTRLNEEEALFFEGIRMLKTFPLVDGVSFMQKALADKKRILAEGAQGTLLDIDCGTYPYVTSSSTQTGGACTGLGVPPAQIGRVLGVAKAYVTRVGAGPLLTQIPADEDEKLRTLGQEFGATTGRNRRCGWLDLPALRYAAQLNGVSEMFLTKVDVLAHLDKVKVCVAYEKPNGQRIRDFSPCLDWHTLKPVYEELSSWPPMSSEPHLDKSTLSPQLMDYVRRVEQEVNTKISFVSYGTERNQMCAL